ncbi:MAG: single-strand binding protein [Firmicutes bacterium]|nr:single-strand binding protein [Bacillota bacterium]
MNKVILVGRLTRDPDVRTTQTGRFVASFTLAVDRIVAKGAEQQTDFIPVVAWGQLAELIGNHVAKGHRLLVDGRMQVRTYEKDGQKRWVTEVIAQNVEFLERKGQAPVGGGLSDSQSSGSDDISSFGKDVFPGEEIPF